MNPDQELMDAIFRDKVLRARAQSPGEKIFAGPRLFDEVCQRMIWGIRGQFPDLDEEGVQKELERRLKISRIVGNRRVER